MAVKSADIIMFHIYISRSYYATFIYLGALNGMCLTPSKGDIIIHQVCLECTVHSC